MARSLRPHEIIIADGGSTDATLNIAEKNARLVQSSPGRGTQMNAGAAIATGDVLLFLHADTRLHPHALEAVQAALANPGKIGGIFDAQFAGDDWAARFFNWVYHYRRYFGIFYGDAGIFVRREAFQQMHGFRNIPLMEDYEFGRRLYGPLWRRGQRMAFLHEPIFISDRRWRKAGLFRTLCTWVFIQTLFSLGFPAEPLARIYRPVR
jgi:rSAM/selenodomain-associated transferase 2